jgi:hypothetical protein
MESVVEELQLELEGPKWPMAVLIDCWQGRIRQAEQLAGVRRLPFEVPGGN